jgi:hypothetical protein
MEKSAKSRKVMCFVCQATFSIVVTVVLFPEKKNIKKKLITLPAYFHLWKINL